MASITQPDLATPLRASRRAIFIVFIVMGATLGNWAARIPQVQQNLGLSEGALGLVLLGLALGVVGMLSLVGGLIGRYGSRRITLIGALLNCLALLPLALLPSGLLLFFGLVLFGITNSMTDVAMNAQAVELERQRGKPIMNFFHAGFSIGNVLGAATGAIMAGLGVSVLLHFALVALVLMPLVLLISGDLLHIPTESEDRGPTFRLPGRALWPLGAVAFASAIGEGAMTDWSAVYLTTVVGSTPFVAGLGFAAFSAMMTIGRLSGDAVTTRFGRARVVRLGGGLAGAGLLLATLLPETALVLLGFGMVGAGLSIVIPLAFSAAGRLPGVAPGAGIAGVATIGYAGFLAGPPVIGLLAQGVSFQAAMLLVALLAFSLLFTGRAIR